MWPENRASTSITVTAVHSAHIIYHDINSTHAGLEKEASPKDLQNELHFLAEWYWFGLNLNISESELRQIKKDNSNICQDCLQDLLHRWGREEKMTWNKVVQALLNIKEYSGAKRIAEKYSECHIA